MQLFISADTLLEYDVMQRASNDAYVNDATVTAQLKDSDGDAVGDPVTLAYVTGSDGKYQGTLESTVTSGLTVDDEYWLEVTVVSATLNDFRRIRCEAVYHSDT